MPVKPKLVACPLCCAAHGVYQFHKYGNPDWRKHELIAEDGAIQWAPCPLCTATGKVRVELRIAFLLVFDGQQAISQDAIDELLISVGMKCR